jgi:phospholipid/cholesterol/gamma-HCH transport system permease protein
MLLSFVNFIGAYTLAVCTTFGSFSIFLAKSVKVLFTTKLKINKVIFQMAGIGVDSITIIILTGAFTGMVFALQSYIGFQRVGGEQFIGAVVALAMVRELGPVLTGLMVTGRAGSAITAEIGSMRITEQIDALKTLNINPYQYLIIPRILASTIIMPFLAVFCMICGVIGGYFVCVYVLGLSSEDYISGIHTYVEMSDIVGGLIKSAVFGFILSWIGSYKGYTTSGGARGVGKSTTSSVVIASILILISNYFLTKVLEHL